MSKRNAISILGAVLWGALLYTGVVVTTNASVHSVPGYPSTDQLRFYVFFPEAMTILSAGLIAFISKCPKWLGASLLAIQFALLPAYLFFYTGGI